jgi:2-polyprenyl-3-methyl-5-hydroxy-6-metoxy-1,4-benzoquinol methylase
MSTVIHYTNCPVCNSDNLKEIFKVKDFTVSGEVFPIVECNSCSLRFTQDLPSADSIASYYQSADYISHSNTSKGIINRLYKFVRNRTMTKKRRLIEKITGGRKGKLLDVGSGVGTFLNEMKYHGWQVTGLEPDATARKKAKELYQLELNDTNLFYKLDPSSFDAITLWHVLEHVHDLANYIQQLKLLLKDEGKLFIAVPNYTSKDAAIYKEFWAAYDVPRHLYHFCPKAMQILIEKNGLKLLDCKAMWYDSFYISLLSSKYKNACLPEKQGKANLFTAPLNGLLSNFNAMGDVKTCSSVVYIISK